MELLGTKNGSTPGPTAAKAEIAYQQQNAQKEKDKVILLAVFFDNYLRSWAWLPKNRLLAWCQTRNIHWNADCVTKQCRTGFRAIHQLCTNIAQIRGFHILWHLAKDMGIMRYICKFCGFAHDRSQSVQTHGKKEHGADDVVLDKIKVWNKSQTPF